MTLFRQVAFPNLNLCTKSSRLPIYRLSPQRQQRYIHIHIHPSHRTTPSTPKPTKHHPLDITSPSGPHPQPHTRTLTTTMPSPTPTKKDWSSTQYTKFLTQRTRPVHDLIAFLAPHIRTHEPRIYDLGCGPGNSTSALLSAFPNARVTGMDSSPDMLARATKEVPGVEFVQGDLASFEVAEADGKGKDEGEGGGADLIFSNAVFHWLRSPTRLPTLVRFFQALKPGGVLAIQVPDNYTEPSHRLMRETATMSGAVWAPFFADTRVGDVHDGARPDLDPIESPGEFYDALVPWASSVDVWRTSYQHVLKDAGAIVEWVKGTGLQPYLNRIEDEGAKKAFLEEYERRLKGEYRELVDGKVMLAYPRLFVVAVKK